MSSNNNNNYNPLAHRGGMYQTLNEQNGVEEGGQDDAENCDQYCTTEYCQVDCCTMEYCCVDYCSNINMTDDKTYMYAHNGTRFMYVRQYFSPIQKIVTTIQFIANIVCISFAINFFIKYNF